MTDTYPRLDYAHRMPSTVPNLWNGGYKNEASLKVYLELLGSVFELTLVANLDAWCEARIERADYMVRYGDPRRIPHVLEAKTDLRKFLNSLGPEESPLYEGIRTDDEAYKPHNLSWPSIVFAGTDDHDHRGELEERFPGEVIVADEDAPKYCPTFSEFQQSLARAFEAHPSEVDTETSGTVD
ncbi:hypothetical protein [Halopelagius inordinatus]|uniref:hypothetical protein n=1 Tax=Halopelagius inordinatus TaxID=553467 RepID=UPI001160AD16|nr:hypothetical protein [Halopelagius inordinatus]